MSCLKVSNIYIEQKYACIESMGVHARSMIAVDVLSSVLL